jgi:signal transduction histidine kinase
MPAAWLSELTAEQKELWDTARAAEGAQRSADEFREAVQAFLKSEPPAAAKANAELALLTLELGTTSGFEAASASFPSDVRPTAVMRQLRRTMLGDPNWRVDRLLQFARRSDLISSESGLPLAAVALARAFREAEATGLNAALFDELTRQISAAPSMLIPHFLDAADGLAAGPVAYARPGVQALRDRWTNQERLRALTRHVQSLLRALGATTNSLWLNSGGLRWLAILTPGELTTPDSANRQTPVGRTTEISFYPKAAVQRAVTEALNRAAVSLPPYLQIRLAIEGESLSFPPYLLMRPGFEGRSPLEMSVGDGRRLSAVPGGAPSTLFAREAGQLVLPRQDVENAKGQSPAESVETLPDRPRFTLELRLTDPARLYASARQRALLFGGLIVAAAATSLVGLGAARRAFARQLRLNEMKSNFVSSVSHELRAPIASVRLLAESLERGTVADPGRQAEYFKLIVQECRRLGALITNVLDFSRIDQGRKQYEFEPTDLTALVQQTVQLMEPYAAERQVGLQVSLDPSSLVTRHSSLNLDGRALQQALVNLLDNAIKHAPAATTVTVGLESDQANAERGMRNAEPGGRRSEVGSRRSEAGSRKAERGTRNAELETRNSEFETSTSRLATRSEPEIPGRILIWVEDSGAGIPPEEHARIFEPFYRRGSELRRETQGVGIGLTIVKHVVEAHGGRVTVRSAVGQGSRFTIELPANPNARGETSSSPD